MAALTQDRNTPKRDGSVIIMPVAGTKKIYSGAIVARNSSGFGTPGATSTSITALGRAESQADNTSGADGAVSVEIRKGIFRYGNSSSGDAIARVDIGNNCYMVDDQTVAKTDGTGTRSVAGKVFDVDSDGVWVRFE